MRRLALVAALIIVASPAAAGPLDETRFTNLPPARDAKGDTLRRSDVLTAFKRAHPCPPKGTDPAHPDAGFDPARPGACQGWVLDHVAPLDCGGADSVANLQWLPTGLWRAKSKWERKVYGGRGASKGCP